MKRLPLLQETDMWPFAKRRPINPAIAEYAASVAGQISDDHAIIEDQPTGSARQAAETELPALNNQVAAHIGQTRDTADHAQGLGALLSAEHQTELGDDDDELGL
jgi:hypothetical protein